MVHGTNVDTNFFDIAMESWKEINWHHYYSFLDYNERQLI